MRPRRRPCRGTDVARNRWSCEAPLRVLVYSRGDGSHTQKADTIGASRKEWPVADKHTSSDISRREFGTRIGAAAGLALAGDLLPARASAAPHAGGRILG